MEKKVEQFRIAFRKILEEYKKCNGGEGSGVKGHTTDIKDKKEKNFTSDEEIKQKQAKIKIDFNKDNYLPELNKEDLEELGKEDKPVLLKKNIIDRNRKIHPDILESEYNLLISKALYKPTYIFSGNNPKYTNFISKLSDNSNSTVLLEMSNEKDNYEIIHLHKIRDRSLTKMKSRDEKR